MKKRLLVIILAVLIVVLSLPLWFALGDDIVLNQLLIGQAILRRSPMSLATAWDQYHTLYSLGLNELGAHKSEVIAYEEPRNFLGYLWRRLPSYAVVYPTETYYYYQVKMPDGVTISGNLRLLDAGSGIIRIGYFDKNKPHDEESENWVGAFGAEEGMIVRTISPNVFDATYNDKTIRFSLTDFAPVAPQNLKLLPEEEFVSQIFDESGIRFVLLYNTKTSTFYFVINDAVGINEEIQALEGPFSLGERTGYVYYKDSELNRTQLVAVRNDSIYDNSYFDGPFDQVPPRLPIKEKLEAAYPYVVYRGGIDEHGNFNNIPGSRVAISPYFDYDAAQDVPVHFSSCVAKIDPSDRWSCLAYEWKKDFHKTLEGSGSGHAVYFSQGWPANHEAKSSLAWPSTHEALDSSTWEPNYLP
jgi:hypothetical protein